MSEIVANPQSTPQVANRSKKERLANVLVGKVVSVVDSLLVIANKEGKERSRTLTPETKFTRDGSPYAAMDLKAGDKIRVTSRENDRNTLIGVEFLEKNIESVYAPV